MKKNVEPEVLNWINENGLRREFNEAFATFSKIIPEAEVERVYMEYEPSPRVVCVVDGVGRTDFIVKRCRFFDALADENPKVYSLLRVLRRGRFGKDSSCADSPV